MIDDTILMQLGTTNPGRTDEERTQWTDGLRGVIKSLRQKSVKDPEIVASAIADFRRTYFRDPTKVLNL